MKRYNNFQMNMGAENLTDSSNVVKAKEYLLDLVSKGSQKYSYLPRHLAQVERWAKQLLQDKPEADPEVTILSVWLHDSGLLAGPEETDHAVNSEAEVKRFLPTIDVSADTVDRVAHCVRAHRCKDVQPETIEAKILAVSDSASHMTDSVYIDMANRGEKDAAFAKLDRDLRDVSLFPDLKEKVVGLYEAWKNLLNNYPNN